MFEIGSSSAKKEDVFYFNQNEKLQKIAPRRHC